MRVALDTNAYVRLMAGHPPLRRLLEEAESILIPVTVLGELHAGFARGNRREANARELADFLALPGVETLSVTPDVAERYGLLVASLAAQGSPIPTNDIWIAATVMENGARLISYDLHFDKVPGLLILRP